MKRFWVVTPEYGVVVPVTDEGQGPMEYGSDVIEIEAESARDAIALGVHAMSHNPWRPHGWIRYRWCDDARSDGRSPYAGVRAIEVGAEVILKATKVDGIYEADPKANPDAKLLKRLSYRQVLDRRLQVMDTTAIALCMENHVPIVVFNLLRHGNIKEVVLGSRVGSRVGA